MPFKSKQQAKKFFADPKLRPLAKEFAAVTPSIKRLPTRVGKANSKSAKGASK